MRHLPFSVATRTTGASSVDALQASYPPHWLSRQALAAEKRADSVSRSSSRRISCALVEYALSDAPSGTASSLKTSTRPPEPLASSAASLSRNSPSDPRANTSPSFSRPQAVDKQHNRPPASQRPIGPRRNVSHLVGKWFGGQTHVSALLVYGISIRQGQTRGSAPTH